MSKLDEITKELEALNKNRAEVSESLKGLQGELAKLETELGEKLLENKATSTKGLDEIKAGITRQELILQALDSRIEKTNKDHEKALDEYKQATIAGYKEKSIDMLLEIVKATYKLYSLSSEWLNLSDEYKQAIGKFKGGANFREALSSLGVPMLDVMDKSDLWLTNAYITSADLQEKIKQAGIPNAYERKQERLNDHARIYKRVG